MNTNGNTTNQTTTANDATARIRARAIELLTTTSPKGGRKTPKQCACGCGGWTKGGIFQPGHDAKLLSAMLADMRKTLTAKTDDNDTVEPGTIGIEEADGNR